MEGMQTGLADSGAEDNFSGSLGDQFSAAADTAGNGPSVPAQGQQQSTSPPVGAAVHQRHGGLITGLVGVLLDGLTAGVQTPQGPEGFSQSAQTAAKLPQERQQKAISFQNQQMMQKAQMAQAHVQQMQTRLLASSLEDQISSGLSDAAWKSATKAVEEGRAKMVSDVGSREAAASKWKELHDSSPPDEQGNLFIYPASKSQDGKSQWAVYQSYPNKTLQEDEKFHLDGTESTGGKIPDLNYTFTAGTTEAVRTALISQLTRDHVAKIHAEAQQMAAENKPDQTQVVQRNVGGKPHNILVNKRSGEDIKDLGEATPKPTAAKPEKAEDMAIGTLNGRQVAGTMAELKAAGATGITKSGAAESEKIQNARSLINVFDSDDPDDLGLKQLASNLDKKGKLGPAAASFAEWLNKGKTAANFNAGDDEVQRLFTKMGLATTGLMQVHVGARGSAQMLEHFEDLAKAGEMSSSAFKAALDTEEKYVRMKAMRPDDVKKRFGRDMKTAERDKANDPFAQFGGKKR